jgi:hypothetical protein
LLVIRRDASFVPERDHGAFPGKVARQSRNFGINRPRCVSAGKRDPEFAPLTQRLVRSIQNELGCVSDEILRPKNLAAHSS